VVLQFAALQRAESGVVLQFAALQRAISGVVLQISTLQGAMTARRFPYGASPGSLSYDLFGSLARTVNLYD
jgi:hypothetical protein